MAGVWSSSFTRCFRFRLFKGVISDINELKYLHYNKLKSYSTESFQASAKPRYLLLGIVSVGAGIIVGGGYSYYKLLELRPIPNDSREKTSKILQELPDVPIARKVISATDDTGLDLTLFQYPTCPFCCKVRAFLDYFGISYNVVEVNPVLRQQIRWSDYKKVPIVLVKVDDGYQQLNDSSMIISALGSYIRDKFGSLEELVNYYPTIEFRDGSGNRKKEIMNKYFLMYKNNSAEVNNDEIKNERKWRKWADEELVHMLSPNVYRTKDEALQAFRWFCEVGEWERLFSAWEVSLIVYVGAFMMWIIGKRLKQRHRLKDEVRLSLYDSCNLWIKEINSRGTPYHGGKSPNLADLAVFGVLSSIEGCNAFQDLLDNTKIGTWYWNMKRLCSEHHGSTSHN